MITMKREEFRKKVIANALLALNVPINNLCLKQNLKKNDYYEPKNSIILYQLSEKDYRVDIFTEKQFKIFTKTHSNSWWVLREGDFTAISPLSELIHDNTLKARGV